MTYRLKKPHWHRSNSDKSSNDLKIAYLGMIQNNINRMATSSAIFKGFAATILAGVVTISFKEINPYVLLIMGLPLFSFLALDVYYLRLERAYRNLYNCICQGEEEEKMRTFSLTISLKNDENKNTTICSALLSPSIYLFYLPVLIAFMILVTLRFLGMR